MGRLFGVGVGPGDPELITRKGARLIEAADVIAYHRGPRTPSNVRVIAADLLRADVIEEELRYPATTDAVGNYDELMCEFYDASADRLRRHLRAGRDVVVLAEGDPSFYSTFMYLHDRLAGEFATEVVPGVTSVAGAAAAIAGCVGAGLSRHEDVVTVLPGTLPVPELARRLADTDAAVIMKLGRTFSGVVDAVRQAGRLDEAWYVERASRVEQRVAPVCEVDPDSVPYMSLVVVPGRDRRADGAGRWRSVATAPVGEPDSAASPAELLVVGLGPGPDHWLTREAEDALGSVDHVVGYAPYVNRVPQRAGLTRHVSGNTVEVDRARVALDLAVRGERVAVVSGGDAGIFGMASAVFEAADDAAYQHVPIRVLPGVSAVQAVAARAGALIGGDFAVVSLSDRLKPWGLVLDRLRALSAADVVTALYNPRSNSRPHQLGEAVAVLRAVRGRDTVVVVGRKIGREGESVEVTTLGEFDPDSVDMSCCVVIGSSTTRVTAAGRVWTPRFVQE